MPAQITEPLSTASTDAARAVVLEVVYSVLLESAIGSEESNSSLYTARWRRVLVDAAHVQVGFESPDCLTLYHILI